MDEAKLLELIENELNGDDAAEFRQRVADDPALEAWVAKVRADREILCALQDPELPRDFLSELEPMLARPMLVDPVGGMNEFEKRHHRHRRAMKFALITRRVAMAASVVLVAGAGLWAASQFMAGGGGTGNPVADGSTQPDELLPQPAGDGSASAIDPEATVHHFAPPDDNVRIASNAASDGADGVPGADLPRGIALVIRAGEASTIEATLAAAMTPYSDRGALVRNFSYDDAVAIDQQMRRDARANPGDVAAPVRADVNDGPDRSRSDEMRRLAERIRAQRQGNPRSATNRPEDELLLGNRNRMPSYEKQLEFSSIGARFSVAVPGDAIDDLLRFLVIDRGVDAQLIVLPEAAGIGEQQEEISADQWMRDRTAVAAWLRAHANHDTGAVPLPVIIIGE